jgi:UDP-N-acetylglucosamine transferase subunit ALG13
MIFLTIGTQEPFDRLIKAVDELVGEGIFKEEVIGQTGSGYCPLNFKSLPMMEKTEFDRYMEESTFVISHAGMGSIITAHTLQKPMIVMPRLRKYREHVNDHQFYTAVKFEELGLVMAARDKLELKDKLQFMYEFKPSLRQGDIEKLIAGISDFILETANEKIEARQRKTSGGSSLLLKKLWTRDTLRRYD